jgi:hypothetical protein
MTSKVVDIGYGKAKRVKIGRGDKSVPVGSFALLSTRITLSKWMNSSGSSVTS